MIRKGTHPSAIVESYGSLEIPECAIIEPQSVLYVGKKGAIQLGKKNTIYPQVSIRVDQGWIRTGDHVSIGSGTHIYEPRAGLEIGDNVLIAGGCLICGVEHGYQSVELPMRDQPSLARKITIGSDVWLGMGVILFPGVSIGNGAVIGGGSIVTKDIPPYSVAYGQPCTVQRTRK